LELLDPSAELFGKGYRDERAHKTIYPSRYLSL